MPLATEAAKQQTQEFPGPARDKETVNIIKAVHSMWDRTQREWAGTVARSTQCANTQNCQFEKDLAAYMKQGQGLDMSIMATEKKHIAGQALSDQDITDAANHSHTLKDLVKTGNKLQSALKQWFKM